MMYRNKEGYADPTAGAALSRIMREYRHKRKSDKKSQCKKSSKKKADRR